MIFILKLTENINNVLVPSGSSENDFDSFYEDTMKFKSYLKKEFEETRALLKCIPAVVVTLFVVSVISMNILANKTLTKIHSNLMQINPFFFGFGKQRLSATKKETLKNSTAWHHWDGIALRCGSAN
mgnify:CR=1 FL=1